MVEDEGFFVGLREPLFFMHIPKTAGTSMRLFLNNNYPRERVCPANNWKGLLDLESHVSEYDLFQGHFQFNAWELAAANARSLVILRNPVSRTISAIRHLQRDPTFHRDHRLAKDLSIQKILQNEYLMRHQWNIQAQYLCASASPQTVLNHLEAGHSDFDPSDLEDEPTSDLACERLRAIDFIGLSEDLDTAVAYMSTEMNYHPATYFPFINEDRTQVDREELDQESLTVLESQNNLDSIVYDFAVELIKQRSFEQRLSSLAMAGIYRTPPGSFEVDLSGVIPGSGWYEPEFDGDRVWRWTGPTRNFTVEVPLLRASQYDVILRFSVASHSTYNGIRVKANGTPLQIYVEGCDNSYEARFRVSNIILARSNGCCRLVFDTLEVMLVSVQDLRKLGIAVSMIRFEILSS